MKPTTGAVDSSGFDTYIGGGKKVKAAADISVQGARWPTADEVADSIKKIGSSSGTADVARTPFQFNDPAYFDPLLFFIQHRDRKELNFRLRHAYEYEPVVGNLIDLHRQMPLSSFKLTCKDKTIERHFNDFADKIELLNLSSYTIGDTLLLGEACWYKKWDDYNREWKEITLIPPEKVELRKTYLTKDPLALLHVDADLKRLVNSADPVDQAIVKMLDPDLVEKIKTQDRIAIPSHQFYHFANKTSASDLRGTSILKRGLYALLLKYKLRMLENAYLDRGIYPIRIWKVGSPEAKWVPNRSHFEALRNQLAAASNDPSWQLIYHYGLTLETHGTSDKWGDLIKYYDHCDKELMFALFANDALLQSKGQTFSNSNVSVRVLLSRYQMIRSTLELAWKNQVFRSMAEARDYWVPDRTGNTGDAPVREKGGKFYYLDLPKFKWAKLNLLDDTSQKQFLVALRQKLEIPHKTICEIFDLDPDEVKQALKDEESTVVDPVYIEARKSATKQPMVLSQVLQGYKTKEWILEKSTPEEQAKKQQQSRRIDSPAGASEGVAPTPGAPGPAPAAQAPRPGMAPGQPPAPQSDLPASPQDGPVSKSPL